MENDELEISLKAFRDYVIQQAKSNLSKQKKNASKTLYNSLKGKYNAKSTVFDVTFEMAYYGQFIDWGVSGVKRKCNTPFKFTNKMRSEEHTSELQSH